MGKQGESMATRIEALRNNWVRDEDPQEILDLVIEEEGRGYERKP